MHYVFVSDMSTWVPSKCPALVKSTQIEFVQPWSHTRKESPRPRYRKAGKDSEAFEERHAMPCACPGVQECKITYVSHTHVTDSCTHCTQTLLFQSPPRTPPPAALEAKAHGRNWFLRLGRHRIRLKPGRAKEPLLQGEETYQKPWSALRTRFMA